MITLRSTHAELIAEMERIRVMYRLKHTMRYLSQRDQNVHSESVAEHIYSMKIIAQYFLPLEDSEEQLNRVRIDELILFHELGEIETGDIIFHKKSDKLRREERKAAARVAKQLPKSIQTLSLDRVKEFDSCKTPEARFAYAIDKIEPIFEMFEDAVLPLFRIHGISREVAVGGKKKACDTYPYLMLFINAWEQRLVSLKAFPS